MNSIITLTFDIYDACRTNIGRAQLDNGHYDLNKLVGISGANFDRLMKDLQWCAERKETNLAIEAIKYFAQALLSAYEIQETSYKK